MVCSLLQTFQSACLFYKGPLLWASFSHLPPPLLSVCCFKVGMLLSATAAAAVVVVVGCKWQQLPSTSTQPVLKRGEQGIANSISWPSILQPSHHELISFVLQWRTTSNDPRSKPPITKASVKWQRMWEECRDVGKKLWVTQKEVTELLCPSKILKPSRLF